MWPFWRMIVRPAILAHNLTAVSPVPCECFGVPQEKKAKAVPSYENVAEGYFWPPGRQ